MWSLYFSCLALLESIGNIFNHFLVDFTLKFWFEGALQDSGFYGGSYDTV